MACECTLIALGYSFLAYIAYRLLTSFYNIFYPYLLATPADLHQKAGAKWAVVTGSTDGIGKQYAIELARKKFNVLLVSRTQSKLDDTKKEILETAKEVEVRTFAFDFGSSTTADYKPLLDVLAGLEIGVLVNNVGMSYEYPEVLHAVHGGLDRIAHITTINTLPPTLLSAAVIPQMLPRHAGVIINISSAASYNLMSHWAVYSATKKYVTWLSNTLRLEYEDKGITVQTICPMLVATKMSKIRRTSFFGPDAVKFVNSALRTIGIVPETTGYLSHQMQVELLNALPAWLVQKLILNHSIATRAAALRKRDRENKDQ